MGERKANSDSKRLLLRLEWPRDQVMVVGVNLERDFLERAWKLILICEKIRHTMHGPARVIIQNAQCDFDPCRGNDTETGSDGAG
jgi:hypothetical protein